MRSTRSFGRLALSGLTLCLAAAALPALAQNSVTFNVRIAITTSCTIAAAAPTDVDFGTVASTATAPVLAQGTITAQCSALTPYSIALNAGSNAATAGDVTTRRMRNVDAGVTTNNFVGYQLYQDAGRTNVWGATTATNTVAAVGTGLPQAYNVYGRVLNPSVNNAAAGSYLDTVTATITY
ncbi:spore coat protein U domain-containing protein [Stenotrophomonas sp. 169]|uniref:Csu type fimbrial protein n=1 Tax=Stenotrophomonas sp. 169 TaxID=2770322 RepID=UPI0016625F66|nr:spore coat U domain-containing protein [Stenotrophomonas sp. 169]QNR96351.1 spore coat protein U domain-containing protein [Stenotrophomonas sp. 169]